MRACPTHAPTFAHPRVRVSVRVRLGAHVSALKRLSPFHRRGRLRAARLAGVQRGVGVQCRHRRVEHRARQRLDRGMRRFSAGGAPPRRTRSAGLRCGTAAPPMRAHTRIGTRLGGCPRVYVCAEKMEYMYANISVYIYCNRSGLLYMEHTSYIWHL
jgi:hypothetical protein